MYDTTYDITETDLNPRFLFSGIQTKTEENEYHSHDFIELIIILQGKGRFIIDGETYEVKEGHLVILNPGTLHRSSPDGQSDQSYVECYLGFTNVEFRNCPKNHLPLFRNREPIVKLPEEWKQLIFHLCGAINQESSRYEAGRSFMLKAYLIQVLCLIERLRRQDLEQVNKGGCSARYEFKSITKKYIVQNIMKYMEENYREKISLDQIADNMYLSSYYISKLFKSETGDTPINYLISLRMRKAREILDKDPERSVQEVAAAVGYEDAYHFSKLFKKYYGLSPMHYKARTALH